MAGLGNEAQEAPSKKFLFLLVHFNNITVSINLI